MKVSLKKYLWLIFPLIFSFISFISFYHHQIEAADSHHDHGSCNLCMFTEGFSRVTLPDNSNAISLILVLALILSTFFYIHPYSQPTFGLNKSRSPPLN